MTFRVLPDVNKTTSGDSTPDNEEHNMQIDEIRWASCLNPRDNEIQTVWDPSLAVITNREKTKLLDIVYDVEVLLYSSGGPLISAQDILNMYSRFITWREDLPCAIGNTSNKRTRLLPHALSML
jgi:hypothetical protein